MQHAALLIPQGDAEAYYIGPGDAVILQQQVEKTTHVYDAYGDTYLKRLISGPVRLSYNPAAGTSQSVLSFIHPAVLEDLRRDAAAETIKAALKSGKSLRESMEVANARQVAFDAISSIEITEKEYLIYEETKQITTAITADNYREKMQALFAGCPKADPDEAKDLSKKIKSIRDAVVYLNKTCF